MTNRLVKFVMGRGSTKDIDDETDAYSDGEDEKDSIERRRENREALRVVKAEGSAIRSRASTKAEFKGTSLGSELTIDTTTSKTGTRAGFAVDGISQFTEKTLTAAREIDYDAKTAVYQTRGTSRGRNGLDQDTQRTFLSFDISAVLEDYMSSKKYGYFAACGVVSLVVFGFVTWHAVVQLYSYL